MLIVLATIGMSLLCVNAANVPDTSTAALGEGVAAIAGFAIGAALAGAVVSHFDLTGNGLGGSLAAGLAAAVALGFVYGIRDGPGIGALASIVAFVLASTAALAPWFTRIRASSSFRD